MADRLTDLAIAARDGDRRALERFVAETQGDVWRLCRYLGGGTDPDDLAQETYERAIGSLHRFRGEAAARTWLLSIARRTCADATRRAVRRRRLDVRLRSNRPETTVGPTAAGELDDVLALLDPERRAAFVLTQVLGLRYDETAEVLGCPVGTVRSRVSRAREVLVAALSDDVDLAGGADAPS